MLCNSEPRDEEANMRTSSSPSSLRQALTRYVEARSAALFEARRELKIGEADARALLFIADHPGTRPTQLSEYLGITSAGVTAMIDRLIDRGVVRREVDAKDRRVIRITATIDVAEDPWASLTRFDSAFDSAIADGYADQTEELAAVLHSIMETTLSGSR
jgi:DNA-binding MarR family transcriptional regulator